MPPPIEPNVPPSAAPLPSKSGDNASIMNSPFAKMFAETGVSPTPKQLQAIINNILKDMISQMKKNDARWKEAMRKLKEAQEES